VFSAPGGGAARAVDADEPIETLRALAVVLLVTYHVIGAGPANGLGIDYPHPLRVLNDLLADLRMPAFAFVAGYVYAVRPVAIGGYGPFVTGKVRRLLVPGAVAATAFALMGVAIGTGFARGLKPWEIYLYPFAHYWFLQAIFLIFAVLALVESRTGPRAAGIALILVLPVHMANPYWLDNLFSNKQALYLAPYFLAGVLYRRHLGAVRRHALALGLACAVAVALSLWSNLATLAETGALSEDRRDLQSLALGLAAPVGLMLALPRVSWLARFGAASFTIYLYHVLATSGSRRLLEAVGVEGTAPLLIAGVVLGIAFPLALHVLAERTGPTRRLVLGQRR
jgi:fucose 4-O-acetylase-like acetyltransferase